MGKQKNIYYKKVWLMAVGWEVAAADSTNIYQTPNYSVFKLKMIKKLLEPFLAGWQACVEPKLQPPRALKK